MAFSLLLNIFISDTTQETETRCFLSFSFPFFVLSCFVLKFELLQMFSMFIFNFPHKRRNVRCYEIWLQQLRIINNQQTDLEKAN